MRKKLITAAILSAVTGATFMATPSVASEKKIECVRKPLNEGYTKYPLKYQKDCDIPLGLTPPPTSTPTGNPGGGSYSS